MSAGSTSRRAKDSHSVKRTVAVGACLIAFALMASFGLTAALDAANLTGSRYLSPFRSDEGWSNDAAAALARGDISAARVFSARAISASPLRQPNVRLAADIEMAAEDRKLADRYLNAASKLGWRDTPTQAKLMISDAKAGDFGSVILRLDALQRRSGVSNETQQFAVVLLSEGEVREPFLKLLETNPPWRPDMFGTTEYLDGVGAARFADALVQLHNRGVQLDDEEVFPVLQRLVDIGASDALTLVAPELLGPGSGKELYDPQFDRLEASLGRHDQILSPFAWRLGSKTRATVNILRDVQGVGNVLSLSSRSRVSQEILSQTMLLEPGAYELEYQIRGKRSTPESDFTWQVSCNQQALPSTISKGAVKGRWQSETLFFVIPTEGCLSQKISLGSNRNLSGAVIERDFAGLKLQTSRR
jgi:hypothetical protein